MEKSSLSLGNLWLPYVVAVALVAVGIFAGPRTTPTRPGLANGGADELTGETQNIPARLWQDPVEATEPVRRAVESGDHQSNAFKNSIPFERLIAQHTYNDCVETPPESDCTTQSHRVLFQFVSLPSDPYPEAGEQRIRARVAVVSALSTAGYRPVSPNRLGVTVWPSAVEQAVTAQRAYAFEVFQLDWIRKVLFHGQALGRKFDEIVVVYLEEDALQANLQFEWVKRLSRVLAQNSPRQRFDSKHNWISGAWLGPISSDRLIALLRSVKTESSSGILAMQPSQDEAVPISILSARPTMERDFVAAIVQVTTPVGDVATNIPWKEFSDGLNSGSREVKLAQRCNLDGGWLPWITLERLGCDDATLTEALVHELKLRRPKLFSLAPRTTPTPSKATAGAAISTPPPDGTVVLISEWDTLYGQVLPESFAGNFRRAGGYAANLKNYTYLRGLDGQIAAGSDKTSTAVEKRSSDVTKAPDSVELFRQLLKSRAPSLAYGRTQVDYVDRFAAQLRAAQKLDPSQRLEAVAVLGSDPYDKLLILQGLRKEFPSVLYFTTQMDASLYAPENYDVTRNLIVATGFDLFLHEKYQQKILPFRDWIQASLYFSTLHASGYFTMKQNQGSVGAPFEEWYPSVVEIGRGGPFSLKTEHSPGSLDNRRSIPSGPVSADPPALPEEGTHSPLVDSHEGAREAWQRWLVPLIALGLVIITALTDHGRVALRHSFEAVLASGRIFSRLGGSRGRRETLRRLWVRFGNDLAVWLLMAATVTFLVVAFFIPRIAQCPDQEPFVITEGISSWPSTWLRALGLFLCACYFWIIAWRFRHALAVATYELASIVPDCSLPDRKPTRPTPCKAWAAFRHRSRGLTLKVIIIFAWLSYIGAAFFLFKHLEIPAQVTRGERSMAIEQFVLIATVFSINLLIVYAVVHNLSCSFFVRRVAHWLRHPDTTAQGHGPLHAALMRAIGHIAGVMTQMIYYPFTLLFLLIAARHPLFDNFDWPVLLITVFSLSSGVLLASTLVLRRSSDRARRDAITWLETRIATLNWEMIDSKQPAEQEAEIKRAQWQLDQVNVVGGAALSEGLFSNPLLRAVMIPLGGTGVLQLLESAGKLF